MTTNVTGEIRGMGFHPPAKALIKRLPTGTQLELVREPENPYDPNAIQVWVAPAVLPEDQRAEFEMELAGWGKTLEEFLEAPQWMLGFVAKETAANIAGLMDREGASASATFSVSGAGKPQAEINIE